MIANVTRHIRNLSNCLTFLNIYQNGKFYWPKMSKSLFITKFNFFMSFDYLDKSAYDTDDSNRISY